MDLLMILFTVLQTLITEIEELIMTFQLWESFLISVGLAFTVLIHELGHAGMMKIFGIPIVMIEWGVGPRIVKFKCLEVRLIPLAGGVYPNGTLMAHTKVEAVLVGLGGVLAQWLGMWIIGVFHLHHLQSMEIICISYGAGTILSLLCLVPFGRNDGTQIVKALKRNYKEKI